MNPEPVATDRTSGSGNQKIQPTEKPRHRHQRQPDFVTHGVVNELRNSMAVGSESTTTASPEASGLAADSCVLSARYCGVNSRFSGSTQGCSNHSRRPVAIVDQRSSSKPKKFPRKTTNDRSFLAHNTLSVGNAIPIEHTGNSTIPRKPTAPSIETDGLSRRTASHDAAILVGKSHSQSRFDPDQTILVARGEKRSPRWHSQGWTSHLSPQTAKLTRRYGIPTGG